MKATIITLNQLQKPQVSSLNLGENKKTEFHKQKFTLFSFDSYRTREFNLHHRSLFFFMYTDVGNSPKMKEKLEFEFEKKKEMEKMVDLLC